MKIQVRTRFSIFFLIFAFNLLAGFTLLADPPREEPHPRRNERGREYRSRPEPGHPHFDETGRYVPHPGWHEDWKYETSWRPAWTIGVSFAPFVFMVDIPPGYWQCTAFERGNPQGFSDYGPGPDYRQAAYAALYTCAGGPDYQAAGCYIPSNNYCQRR
jgi:hypothetical protein